MPKKRLSVAFLCLCLVGCGPFEDGVKEKLPYDDQYGSVCEEGKLNIHDGESSYLGINVLPIGYHGAYPDKGIYEIGGRAGDPQGSKVPKIDFGISDVHGTTLLATIAFDSNPYDFPTNKITRELGIEYSYQDTNGKEKVEKIIKQVTRLSEMLLPSGADYYQGGRIGRGNFFVYTPANAMGLSIKLYPKEKLNYIRYIYGDLPQHVVNAAIFREKPDLKTCILSPYSGNDCSRLNFTKSLGSHHEFNMISQYGYVYSKDYLLSCFIVKDEYDNTQDHVSKVKDPDNYFTTASTAPIGKKYDVTFYEIDSHQNMAELIFHFTIQDKIGPNIVRKADKEITASYKETFDQTFIDKYFFLTDNYDTMVNGKVVDDKGVEIINPSIGTANVNLVASDSFGNETKLPFTMEVVDDIPPEIDCECDEINLSPDKVITSSDLLTMFKAIDEIDGEVAPIVVENTYSANSSVVGNYIFTVSATDSKGNESQRTLNILVEDRDAPVFFAKDSFLTFAEGEIPDEQEIIQALIRQEVLPDKNYVSSQLVEGEEITDNLPVGQHECTMQYFADDNSSELVDLTINIVSKDALKISDSATQSEEKGELTFWEKIARFFIDLWHSIVRFFTGK